MLFKVIALIALLLLPLTSVYAQTCHTNTYPDSNGSGGAYTQAGGVTYPIVYTNSTLVPIGLEFWFHAFWAGGNPAELYYLVYINRPTDVGRRIFWASNIADEYQTGKAISFPMSTFVQPGETFVVASVNNTGSPAPGYLIVTIRECN